MSYVGIGKTKRMEKAKEIALRHEADRYRRHIFGCGKHGFVVIFGNEVAGWITDLTQPQAWAVDCYAVPNDPFGPIWKSITNNGGKCATSWFAVELE